MSKVSFVRLLPCLGFLVALAANAQQVPPAPVAAPAPTTTSNADNPESLKIEAGAKQLAGSDPVLNTVWAFFCTPTHYLEPAAEIEPTQVFDNLYAIPNTTNQETTVWAITTSDGIVLLDSGFPGKAEVVVAGLQKVGLDPAKVKFILLGHGHNDHYGGAAYFQSHYGTRVGTTAADWDLMYPAGKPATSATFPNLEVPKRDLVLKEGAFKVGSETFQLIEIPGHTPGALAFIFPVKDHGKTHTAALFGGTIQDEGRITIPGLKQYQGSIAHYQDLVRKMKVDVEIQNHASFDQTPERLANLKTRKAGEPHPFLMPTQKYLNFWSIVSQCMQAEIARRPPGAT